MTAASFLARWLFNSLKFLGLVVGVPLGALIVFHAFVGWLVAMLLLLSEQPWHYGVIAFVAWVLCVGLIVSAED